ncbi:unnamed protein product, partial [Iphiclides podalirius]
MYVRDSFRANPIPNGPKQIVPRTAHFHNSAKLTPRRGAGFVSGRLPRAEIPLSISRAIRALPYPAYGARGRRPAGRARTPISDGVPMPSLPSRVSMSSGGPRPVVVLAAARLLGEWFQSYAAA